MEQRQPTTPPTRLREPYPALARNLLLPDNVRRDFTGCPPRQDKPAGVWLTAEHMWAVADMAAEALTRPSLARQGHTGHIILTLV